MVDFNVNNSDFYYTGATGSFNNFCNNFNQRPVYLYVPGHDDQYISDNNGGWNTFPWPYLNTNLLLTRPPTPFFSGSGECIGCPKIASNPEYLSHRKFNEYKLSNDWENIYPTGSGLSFLESGSGISFFYESHPDHKGQPFLDVFKWTKNDWDNHGAKIHLKYNIQGNNFNRILVGFYVKYVTDTEVETEDIDKNEQVSISSIVKWVGVDSFPHNLYYEGINKNFDFDNLDPIFIFDSCAVKNVSNEVTFYGPTPGFNFLFKDFVKPYVNNNKDLYVKYFIITKKEGNDPVDVNQICQAELKIAGFGFPKYLMGFYKENLENIGYQSNLFYKGLDLETLEAYKLRWGRGLNTGSIFINGSNILSDVKINFGPGTIEGNSDTTVFKGADAFENLKIIDGGYKVARKWDPFEKRPPGAKEYDWVSIDRYGFDIGKGKITTVAEAFEYYSADLNKKIFFSSIPILTPSYELRALRGNVDDTFQSVLFEVDIKAFLVYRSLIKSTKAKSAFAERLEFMPNNSLLAHPYSINICLLNNQYLDLNILNTVVYMTAYSYFTNHPLFYIGSNSVIPTIYKNKSLYFEHPYRFMIDFLKNFGNINQKQISSNNCSIPSYILTNPISNLINTYKDYEVLNPNSNILSIVSGNLINIKNTGSTNLEMRNFVDQNKFLNSYILSDIESFSKDVEYIFPYDIGLKINSSKIRYDYSNNSIYSLIPSNGYYHYNINDECTNYKNYNDDGFTDIEIGINKIYLSNETNNSIYIFDKSTNNLSYTITGVLKPKSMLLDEQKNRLYVASLEKINIFDINNYSISGEIKFLENEFPIKMSLLNNKLYTFTDSFESNIVIISGINNITGELNTFTGNSNINSTGYKRLFAQTPYNILGVEKNNNIYIASYSGIHILNSSIDDYVGYITGFNTGINITNRISNLINLEKYNLIADEMTFNTYDNKIYCINKFLPFVFRLDTGIKKCDNIIDFSKFILNCNGIDYNANNNKIYINTSFDFANVNSITILGNRPKANISFPNIPSYVNNNTYNLNIKSNNSEANLIYKSSDENILKINNTGTINILNTGKVSIFVGQESSYNFGTTILGKIFNITSNNGIYNISYLSDISSNNLEDNYTNINNINNIINNISGAWIQNNSITGYSGNLLGYSTAINDDGDIFVAGVPSYNNYSGAVFVYTGINKKLSQILSGNIQKSYFGKEVFINDNGSLLCVSGPGDENSVSQHLTTGKTYLYTGINGKFNLKQTINWDYTADNPTVNGFTNSVFLNKNGDTLIIKPSNLESGLIYTGSYNSSWIFKQYISGRYINLFRSNNDGSIIVGAAPYSNLNGDDDYYGYFPKDGFITIFTGSKNNKWQLYQIISEGSLLQSNSTELTYPGFGDSISINSGDIIVVGKSFDNYSFENSYIYILTGSKNNKWHSKQKILVSNNNVNINYNGDIILVNNSGSALDNGFVNIYTGNKNLGWGLQLANKFYQSYPKQQIKNKICSDSILNCDNFCTNTCLNKSGDILMFSAPLSLNSSGIIYEYKYDQSIDNFNQLLPSPPTQINVSNITDTSFILTWQKVPYVNFYYLNIATDSNFNNLIYSNKFIEGTGYTVLNLIGGTKYYIKLNSINNMGITGNSSSVIDQFTAFSTPDIPYISDINNENFRINWKSVVNATGYKFSIATDSNFNNIINPYANKVTNQLNEYITNLNSSTKYYIRISNLYPNGESAYSPILIYKTNFINPQNITVSNIGKTNFNINWDPVFSATNYNVVLRKLDIELDPSINYGFKEINSTTGIILVSGVTNQTSYNFTELNSSTPYFVNISATDGEIQTSPSKIIQYTLPTTPYLITGVPYGIKWVGDPTVTGYLVQFEIFNIFYEKIQLPTTNDLYFKIFYAIDSPYDNRALLPKELRFIGSRYRGKILPINKAGSGNWSNTWTGYI